MIIKDNSDKFRRTHVIYNKISKVSPDLVLSFTTFLHNNRPISDLIKFSDNI